MAAQQRAHQRAAAHQAVSEQHAAAQQEAQQAAQHVLLVGQVVPTFECISSSPASQRYPTEPFWAVPQSKRTTGSSPKSVSRFSPAASSRDGRCFY